MKVVIIGGVAGGFRFYDTAHNDKALNTKSTPCGMDD